MATKLYLQFIVVVVFQIPIFSFTKSTNFFIENKGQWDKDILFLYQGAGLNAWITKQGVCYDFYQYEYSNLNKKTPLLPEDIIQREGYKQGYKRGHIVKINYLGTYSTPSTVQEKKLKSYYNYFLGNNPEKWQSNVGLSQEIIVKNIYPGIDQRWYFDAGYLRYDFIVHPHADYKNIRFKIEGAYQIFVSNQELIFTTRFGEVKQCQLKVYQGKDILPSEWIKNNDEYGFMIRNYDPSQTLVIDPLVWSTFIGGTGTETPNYGYPAGGVFIDSHNNVCVAGTTHSVDYPVTIGAYDITINSTNEDVVVSKLDPLGTSLLFSTFFGGNNIDVVTGIKRDPADNVYIAGWTASPSFPISTGAIDNTLFPSGNPDGFVAKLNSSGSSLVYSSYLGGTGVDAILDLYVDNLGLCYVTGYTTGDYPVTMTAYDNTFNGGSYDAFVTKVSSDATSLIFSSYLGGSNIVTGFVGDRGRAIMVDANYDVYVAGYTESNNFPTTSGSYDISFNGQTDLFVTKFNNNGSSLIYSTFIGGNSTDDVYDITITADNKVYLVGYTFSTNYPTSSGCYDNSYACCSQNVIVSCLNSTGNQLEYSTYLGFNCIGYSIVMDTEKSVYITGITSNPYPTTLCAYDETHNGDFDGFITKLDSSLSILHYSTYVGGSGADYPLYITSNTINEVIITGWTQSLNYPVSTGCYDNTHGGNTGGNTDLFVSKLSLTDICLPVHVFDVVGYLKEGKPYLEWRYQGQERADWFEVYVKNPDSQHWELLSKTKQNYYLGSTQNYSIGKDYYLIIVRDKDGQNLTSKVVELLNEYENRNWYFYPNPAQNNVNIYSSYPTDIQIFDLSGKEVAAFFINAGYNSLEVNLPSGVYLIKSNYHHSMQKIVITE